MNLIQQASADAIMSRDNQSALPQKLKRPLMEFYDVKKRTLTFKLIREADKYKY